VRIVDRGQHVGELTTLGGTHLAKIRLIHHSLVLPRWRGRLT
jgi:hypothetical protein